MSNASIASEKAAAFREVAREVGDGDPTAYLIALNAATNPWEAAGEPVEYEATAYQPKLSLTEIDGTLIQVSDVVLDLVEPQIVPTTAMRIRWKSRTYSIQAVQPFAPAGPAISYMVLARV